MGVSRRRKFRDKQDFHRDCVFDLRWLDDSCLASCSRDSSLALWNIPADADSTLSCANRLSSIHHPNHSIKLPHSTKHPNAYVSSSIPDDRFRALEYLAHFNLLAVVSLSRRFCLYDAVRIGQETNTRPLFTLSLRDAYQEAVALRRWPDNSNCVALATHYCVLLFDVRCANPVKTSGRCVHPPVNVSGIRSLNFAGNILSYGTSTGQVHFYDLRGNERLPLHLDVGPGWVKPNVCDTPPPPISLNDINDFPPHSLGTSRQQYDRTVMNDIDNSINLLSASLSSAPTAHIPPSTSNTGDIAVQSGSQTGGRQTSRNMVTSQVSNLRVRLDRIQHMLDDIRDRGNLMRLRVAVPVSDMTPEQPVGVSFQQAASVRAALSTDQRDSDRPDDPDFEDAVIDTSENMFSGGLDEEENEDWTLGDAHGQESTSEEEVFIVTRPRQHRVRNNLRSNTNFRRTSGSLLWRFPSLTNFSRFISPDFFFPLADLYPDMTPYPSPTNQRSTLAIFTHEYDPSGTRLFTAGGPITSSCYGNVASLWE